MTNAANAAKLVDRDEDAVAPSEGAVYAYVVLDNRWGPAASGSKEACLVFIANKLTEQSEQQALVNPSSYRLVKVRQL